MATTLIPISIIPGLGAHVFEWNLAAGEAGDAQLLKNAGGLGIFAHFITVSAGTLFVEVSNNKVDWVQALTPAGANVQATAAGGLEFSTSAVWVRARAGTASAGRVRLSARTG